MHDFKNQQTKDSYPSTEVSGFNDVWDELDNSCIYTQLGDLDRPPGLSGPGGQNILQWRSIYRVGEMLAHADFKDQREKGNKTVNTGC